MAPQRKLGVLSLWWTGFNYPDPTHTAFDWTALKTDARRARSLHLMAFKFNGGFMNWDQIEGNWRQFKGQVKEMWGKFTDDDLEVIGGKGDKLIGKLQEKYGIAQNEAEAQLKKFQEQSRT